MAADENPKPVAYTSDCNVIFDKECRDAETWLLYVHKNMQTRNRDVLPILDNRCYTYFTVVENCSGAILYAENQVADVLVVLLQYCFLS